MFAPLPALQSLSGERAINVICINGHGECDEGMHAALAALPFLRAALGRLPQGESLQLTEVKARAIEDARLRREDDRTSFTTVSLLVVLSGVTLIVNMVLALSEERRPSRLPNKQRITSATQKRR